MPEPVPAAAAAPRPALRVARLRGTDLHFVEQGSGTPVVLVHGTLGSLDSWRAQVDTFARHFRVVAYSRRYHPPNPARADGQPYSLDLHAGDLIGLIEALRLERVHLVAASYGAYVALQVALERPDLVRSLALTEPPILPWLARTPAGDSLRRAFTAGVLDPARRAFARGDSVEAVRRFLDAVTGRPGGFDALPAASRAALLRAAFEFRLELGADPAAYMPALSCSAVGRIRSPVLLVRGERSPRFLRLALEELARCLPHEEAVTIPGAGHTPHADQPAAYNALVLAFLARN
ncbi:MAG TPA: alpha/beta hydrolase [Gemmatimonadales bacterium]|nr:alpha/beta hydrolase [Gemmatimonadales bacterium]